MWILMITHYGKSLNFADPCSIILEHADGGNLQEYIEFIEDNGGIMGENEVLLIFIQIVKGLSALHKKKIIHRDLKVSTTLLFIVIVCKYIPHG